MRWVSWSRSGGSAGLVVDPPGERGRDRDDHALPVTREPLGDDRHAGRASARSAHGRAQHDAASELAATFSGMVCAPPVKRLSCAPPPVLKFRSKVPGFCSFPEAAM